MRKMAEAFNTTVTALEEELMQLILDGKISARIDSHNKARVLTAFIYRSIVHVVTPLHPKYLTGIQLGSAEVAGFITPSPPLDNI